MDNDCLDEADLSISGRTDNLCTAGADCDDYYFCHSGICTQSTTVGKYSMLFFFFQ